VAKKVHRELRQEREKQIKKKLGSKYTAYKKDISAIVANIKVQLQARNVRDPSRPLRTFQHSFDQMDDNGYVDMSELNESLNDFDVKLDYDSLQTLETYLDIQMNNTFVSGGGGGGGGGGGVVGGLVLCVCSNVDIFVLFFPGVA
jgi:hypothetical protein